DIILRRRPDVLLMDMHLPGMEGREIFRALHSNPETSKVVLIGVSGQARSKDEVTAAFEAGADEYFFKPLDYGLLAVRVKSLLRSACAPAPEETLRHCGIIVFPDSRQCKVEGRDVRLTRLEFDLLVEFIRNPKRVLTRGGLINALWRSESSRGVRAVDRHIHALRTKLGKRGSLLETLVGVGYRLTDRPA
ncbi:MAG: response regulator transcription factor, partial [Elusimicrobia bacterium]|nr:response regulator transcription factor [Elusimicrobiota bacterium]